MNTRLSYSKDRLMRLNNSMVILGKLPYPVYFLVIPERDGYYQPVLMLRRHIDYTYPLFYRAAWVGVPLVARRVLDL